jgi:ubiquinone/menaquinone biosynthesis C-methylase UbiE
MDQDVSESPTAIESGVSALRQLLRCPRCGQALIWGPTLECQTGHRFQIDGEIPILDDRSACDGQHAKQRRYYDREFASRRPYHLENWQRTYLARLDSLWGDAHSRGRFLDVGAGGNAYTVIEAARHGILAVACDLSVEAMRSAQHLANQEGLADRCLFVVCGAEQLPFATGAFTSTASIAVLEHLPDDGRAISEMARVTMKGGRVFMTVPNSLARLPILLRFLYSLHDARVGHLRHYSAAQLAKECSEVGLRVSQQIYSAHWIKAWQLLVHLIAGRLKLNDNGLWWWMEGLDARQSARDNGMHLSLVLERE